MKWRLVFLFALVVGLARPYVLAQNGDYFDFVISETYLNQLAREGILPAVAVHMDARTKKVHTLAADCEIHMATTPADQLGDPPSIVVEPPNVCKFPPPNSPKTTETNLRNVIWPKLFDKWVMGKDCEVTGFPRIFTEHAQGAADPANPNHVLEIHPAMAIRCGSYQLDFTSFLTALPGMRAVKPDTAVSCISQRKLEVRYADEQYQFREEGGQCGNFAIVEVSNLNPKWVHAVKGGHSAIARVSADGKSLTTLKIYTLTGTKADGWLGSYKKGGNARLFLHGMFTFDYFAILRTVRTPDGQWTHPSDWQVVKFPLAFVVFGEAETAPWEEP